MEKKDEPIIGRMGFSVGTAIVSGVLLVSVTSYIATPKEQSQAARDSASLASAAAARNADELTSLRSQVVELRATVEAYRETTNQRVEEFDRIVDSVRGLEAGGTRFSAEDFERERRLLDERDKFTARRLEEIRERSDADIQRIEKRIDEITSFLTEEYRLNRDAKVRN